MALLDWFVVAAYLVSMLAIGAYYARKNKTEDEYLLGGRKMRPFTVGLSLFASLLSTSAYLSMPAEMIQHGPLAFTRILAYPFAYLIGAYLLIPFLMRLDVTSAYEILEKRFGLGIRLMASLIFLTSRMLWMGLILYGLVGKVILPILGLPAMWAPYACAAMGLITVTYTSAGGMRAVVLTDAIQTFIKLAAAVLTVVVVSVILGGVQSWWPKEWPAHWDTFQIGIDREARFTVATAVLSQLVWWVCTAGSDQMAIQRYLSTKDTKTASHVLGISLLASSLSAVLLGLVGLALLAYFQKYPHLMGTASISQNSASELFPRFVVIGLPQGLAGLVIAGILAAAMGSLSSGFNSSSLVIAVDFFDRLGWGAKDDAHRMRRTKLISWCVCALIIFVSTGIGSIRGDLLEVTYKTSNLLVAPLFIPFFTAFFVRRATSLTTFTSTAIAIVAAIWVAYFQDQRGLQVVWIMPMSLAAGITSSLLLAWLPLKASLPPR